MSEVTLYSLNIGGRTVGHLALTVLYVPHSLNIVGLFCKVADCFCKVVDCFSDLGDGEEEEAVRLLGPRPPLRPLPPGKQSATLKSSQPLYKTVSYFTKQSPTLPPETAPGSVSQLRNALSERISLHPAPYTTLDP